MSCTTGEPSTPNIALDPPLPGLFKFWLTIKGKEGTMNGGAKAHCSTPSAALNACNNPSFAPT